MPGLIPCPNCGNTKYKESRQCPKYEGKSVCIKCCYKCKHYCSDPRSLYNCRFYINNNHLYGVPTKKEEKTNIEKVKEIIKEAI